MIKLSKSLKPQILKDNADKWTKEYLDCLDNNQEPTDTIAHRYNNKGIKQLLEQETYGKCAYCESKLKHIEFGDIEHILPKNKKARPDLYVEWSNLTLACEVCNRSNKKDYYDPKLPLVNPYKDNPNEFFDFTGPLITAKGKSMRGFKTAQILGLNRGELVIRRNERLDSINTLFFTWSNTTDIDIKNVLKGELKKECTADKEYSAFVKNFLILKGFPKEELL
jgi:uncharacterized protein (TIGR02646 family)